MAQWASEISLSGPVSLSESVTLVNDYILAEYYFTTVDRKRSDTIS